MTSEAQEKIKSFSANPNQTIRVCEKDAKELLINNQTIVIGGNVRYFQIVPRGIGVYAVKLCPVGFDPEHGTICLAPRSKWLTTEKTLNVKP